MFSPRYWVFFILVIAAVATAMFRLSHVSEVVKKSPTDPYQYQYLQLENGLKVLLVNTPNSDKAAAAMSVDVGSGDDPEGREGLAHFLEHMLFLGTKAYPQAGEYQAFLSRNGGNFNAFTAHQQTTYFFDIDNTALVGALQRFAPFFISPTFDAQYVERETHAVNAEYRAKYKDDFRRIYSAEKQAMNPKHPYASFATGNLDTLADRPDSSIRDELLTFYQQHYSADKMTLVLSGNYPLRLLEAWAKEHFADIPNHNTLARNTNEPLFTPKQLPLDMNIEPVKEIRRLQFSFPLPESRSLYPVKPVQVISNLLGHEGEGSLLAFLKEKGWAEGLSAGRSLSSESENLLVVQIQLTRQGLAHIDPITQALLAYIELIKAKPLPEYLVKEQQQLNELAFRFQEQSRLTDFVVRLSSNLLIYPPQDVIFGDYRFGNISSAQWQPFLNGLDANNMLRTLIAPQVATDTIDPWYETPIRIRPLNYSANADFAEELQQLHLPEANPFIPTDFELHATGHEAHPIELAQLENSRAWYYPEHDFNLPKARIIVQFQQSKVQSSAHERVLAHLYARAVNESLNTFSYPAALAGLNYKLAASNRGLELALGGYQDKLPVLMEHILKTMQQFSLDEAHFQRYQASIKRQLENQLKNKPYERAIAELNLWLYEPSFNETELLAELEKTTLTEVLAFAQSLHEQLSTQMLIHGSLMKAQGERLAALVNEYYPALSVAPELAHVKQAAVMKQQLNLHLDHADNALVLYMQGPDNSDKQRARFALLGQILSAPYYERLRTEEQLGYVVFATQYPQQTVPGLAFIVQAPKATPQQILASSERFFSDFSSTLKNMSAAEFDNYKKGLITLLTENPKNMGEKFARFWRDIEVQRYTFDTNQAIATEVEQLTLEEVEALYQQAISAKLAWVAVTQGGQLEHFKPIKD